MMLKIVRPTRLPTDEISLAQAAERYFKEPFMHYESALHSYELWSKSNFPLLSFEQFFGGDAVHDRAQRKKLQHKLDTTLGANILASLRSGKWIAFYADDPFTGQWFLLPKELFGSARILDIWKGIIWTPRREFVDVRVVAREASPIVSDNDRYYDDTPREVYREAFKSLSDVPLTLKETANLLHTNVKVSHPHVDRDHATIQNYIRDLFRSLKRQRCSGALTS